MAGKAKKILGAMALGATASTLWAIPSGAEEAGEVDDDAVSVSGADEVTTQAFVPLPVATIGQNGVEYDGVGDTGYFDATTGLFPTTGTGIAISDAGFPSTGLGDAYDDMGMFIIGDEYFNPGTGEAQQVTEANGDITVNLGNDTMSVGLVAQVEYRFFAATTGATRYLLQLWNPNAVAINANVGWGGGLGSDELTALIGTEQGLASAYGGAGVFNQHTRFMTTAETPSYYEASGDPIVTSVFGGPGVAPPGFVSWLGGDQLAAFYNVTIPAGETRWFMFFSMVTPPTADPQPNATAWINANGYMFHLDPANPHPYLAGMDPTQFHNVVNWATVGVHVSASAQAATVATAQAAPAVVAGTTVTQTGGGSSGGGVSTTLAATGAEADQMAYMGFGAVALGGVLLHLTRRRRGANATA